MSEYYTVNEMEALFSQKACLNNFEIETYTVKPAPRWRGLWNVTFKRMITGVVTINIYLPNLDKLFADGYVDIVLENDFPRKFRPSLGMYFMCMDVNNQSRCVGVSKEGTLRIFNSANKGCYGAISYIGAPISNCLIQSYYTPSVYEAVTYINQLDSEWSSFVCVSDTHGANNSGHSQSIMRFILENSKATRGFWLGDTIKEFWTSYTKKQYMDFAEEYLNVSNRVCVAYGNHDRLDSVQTGNAGLNRELFNDFLCDKYDVVWNSYYNAFISPAQATDEDRNMVMNWLMQYYYFIDDPATHTRYMVINTSQDSEGALDTNSQLEWIEQCVHFGTGYENWNLVVLGHINIDNNPVWVGHDDENAALIRDAISSSNGRIVGYFCGHQHLDYFSIIPPTSNSGKAIPQMMFTCDSFAPGTPYPGFDYPPNRTVGTINEQAITIVSFNRNNGRVLLKRIGAVTPNMTLEYNYLSVTN